MSTLRCDSCNYNNSNNNNNNNNILYLLIGKRNDITLLRTSNINDRLAALCSHLNIDYLIFGDSAYTRNSLFRCYMSSYLLDTFKKKDNERSVPQDLLRKSKNRFGRFNSRYNSINRIFSHSQ